MNELALFAGAGGGILGGKLLGWRTVCAVEFNEYATSVLLARQNDGMLSPFPIWDDVCTFDGRPWRGIVDVVSGGFPCQDISAAGKGAGITGERSGLWKEFARIIREVGPRYVLVENSPVLTSRGLGVVLGDLAAMGYDAEWGVLGAIDAGAPHRRDRIWIVANAARIQPGRSEQRTIGERAGKGSESQPLADADSVRELQPQGSLSEIGGRSSDCSPELCYTYSSRLEERQGIASNNGEELPTTIGTGWWLTEPDVGRVAHGVAARVDRLKAIGNGQVPAVVELAWKILTSSIT